jgi:CheY-like chemotaxis protein
MAPKVILLVEDNEDDIDLTLRAFAKSNIVNETVIARDGVAALDYLFARGAHEGRNERGTPAVILLDLKLPKIDGLEVLKQIRTNPLTKLIPVVILTSSREDRDRIESYNLGANSYIQKPVDFERFVEAARQVGLYWLVLNEPPPSPEK